MFEWAEGWIEIWMTRCKIRWLGDELINGWIAGYIAD